MMKILTEFDLPLPQYKWNLNNENPLIARERNYNTTNKQTSRDDVYKRFNNDQKRYFNKIINAIETIVRGEPYEVYFFLQNYAGIGKTFLYTAIYQHFRA